MSKPAWLGTLVLSGLTAGIAKLIEHGGAEPSAAAGIAITGAGLAAETIQHFLLHVAHSQLEGHHADIECQERAARNHHIRRGLAKALRRALLQFRQAHPELPGNPYHSLFKSWDDLLAAAQGDEEAALDRFFPLQFAESYLAAANDYRPEPERDARALAALLRELPHQDAVFTGWSEAESERFALQVLPYYQQAFAEDLACDDEGLLFQAFAVKRLNKIESVTGQTLALVKEIRAGQSTPPAPAKVRSWALPALAPYFTGRETFLSLLDAALRESRKALVLGGGGFGKTQAALAYVRRFGDAYEDVLWVNALTPASLFESCRQIASALRLLTGKDRLERPSEEDVQRAFKSWVAAHPSVLVIFDNLDNPAIARDYWPTSSPQPFLLATSRKPSISELDHMAPLNLEVWESAEAVEFLRQRTERDALAGAELDAAGELARETGFLPLALEQAGAYIAKTGVRLAAYLETYRRERLKLLEKPGPRFEGYKESVATTWKASMDRVSDAARELLAAVSHLAPNGNPIELLAASAATFGPILEEGLTDSSEVDPPLALLRSLEEYSLVRVDAHGGTFSMHILLMEVVREDQPEPQRYEWQGRWIEVFDNFLPKGVGARESAPYSRAWTAFEAFFLRLPDNHSANAEVTNVANWYIYHFNHRGRWKEAEPLAVRNLNIRERLFGAEHPATLSSLNNLAGLYESQGRYAAAEPLYVRALEARERVLGREHPNTLTLLNNLAALHESQGRYGEAEPLYMCALEARERVLGPEHPDTLTSVNNLAALYSSQARYGEAEPLCVRALEASERVLGREHPNTLSSLNNLAGLYNSQGRYGEAEPLYVRALEASERVLGREHPNTLSSLNNLAGLYNGQGRYGEAELLYRRALTGLERGLGTDHPSTRIVRENLMDLLEKISRPGSGQAHA